MDVETNLEVEHELPESLIHHCMLGAHLLQLPRAREVLLIRKIAYWEL